MRSSGVSLSAPPGRSRWRPAGTIAVAAVLYAVAGILTLWIAQSVGLAAPVWPAAGIAFALVYQRGWPVAVGVAAGSFAVNAWSLSRDAWPVNTVLAVAVAVGVGAALQSIFGAVLVRRFLGTHLSLTRGAQVLGFLLLAGPASTIVNPTFGVLAELPAGIIEPSQAVIGWATWWVGDAIGVIVFAPLVLMALPEQDDIWRGRRWKVAIPSVAVTFVLLAVFMQNRLLDHERVQMMRDQLADSAVARLQDTVDKHSELLHSIEGLQAASDDVTVDEFRRFTDDALERFPNLQALSWNPYVSPGELASFEAEQRMQPGMADYRVVERTPDGELVPVADREDYVAVGFIEPMANNAAALGFDIGSNPVRREAIDRARDTGEIASTAPIELVQETGSQQGMLTMAPVYSTSEVPDTVDGRRDSLVGFAVGVYRLGGMVTDTFSTDEWNDVDVQLFDVTDESIEIGRRLADGSMAVGDHENPDTTSTSRTFDVNGRQWRVEVRPTAQVLGEAASGNEPLLLFGAMLIIGLLQAFLLVVTGMERQARRRADAAHFQAEHDPLTGLLNRRGFDLAFHAALDRTEGEGSQHVLLYLDLDGFKPVNDRGGHDAGDALLQQIAAAMTRSVRSRDVVARLGGDEFGVLLNDCGTDRGIAIAQSLDNAIRHVSVWANEQDLSVGVSIGVVPITAPLELDAGEIVRRADLACYRAKAGGGGVSLAEAAAR